MMSKGAGRGSRAGSKKTIKLRRHVQENGAFHNIMAPGDVAEMIQRTESTVRGMCKKKAQLGPHPIPYIVLAGRIMFYRHRILAWRIEMEEAAQAKQAARRAVPRGKRKRSQ
jgi:hypothetical protein